MAFLGIRLPDALVPDIPLDTLIQRYPELKWTKPLDLHLTLRFFPERGDAALARLIETIATYRTPVPPFDLKISGAGTFDREKQGGVLWLGLDSVPPALSHLQREFESLAQSLGYSPEPRPFNPHITMGRYRYEDRETVAMVVATVNASTEFHQRFHAETFSLMKRTPREGDRDVLREYQDLLVRPLAAAQ